MDGGTARKRTEEVKLASPNEPRREHGEGLHDEVKIDEDNEENRIEEIADEEQDEEHQKARPLASPDIPFRRKTEDDNLTHFPFRSWYTTVDDSSVENADHVNSRRGTIGKSDFASGQRQKGTWTSLEDGEGLETERCSTRQVMHREQYDERRTVPPGKAIASTL